MQRISRTLRVAAFSVLTALVLPTWAQTQTAPILWQTSWSGENAFTEGVTLANDTLFFMVAGPTLYALDAGTGDFKWNASDLMTGTSTTPVIVEDIALTIMGQVIAWNASTGAYLWTSNQPTTPYGEAVSADLKSRTVFVGVQSSTTSPAPLVALHLDTGAVKWQGVVGNLTNVGYGVGPAVVVPDHDLVCIYTTMSYLVCYDIATGTVAWETCIYPTGSQCYASNAQVSALYYDCGALVVAHEYGGGGYDVSNGTRLWTWSPASNYAVVSNCTVFTYTNNSNSFAAINSSTGALLWTVSESENWYDPYQYPVIAGGNVLVLASNPCMMYMFNMTNGAVTFTALLPPSVGSASTQMRYRKGTLYLAPAGAQTVWALSTLPTVGVTVCTDPACQQCSESFQLQTDQCTTTGDGGSVMRHCSGTEFTVNTYVNSMCEGQPARVANYVQGQCVPSSLAFYMKITSCETTQ
jgi:hypothetical protein